MKLLLLTLLLLFLPLTLLLSLLLLPQVPHRGSCPAAAPALLVPSDLSPGGQHGSPLSAQGTPGAIPCGAAALHAGRTAAWQVLGCTQVCGTRDLMNLLMLMLMLMLVLVLRGWLNAKYANATHSGAF